jgi:hypothetical protein
LIELSQFIKVYRPYSFWEVWEPWVRKLCSLWIAYICMPPMWICDQFITADRSNVATCDCSPFTFHFLAIDTASLNNQRHHFQYPCIDNISPPCCIRTMTVAFPSKWLL